jgi:hypothetical protein
MSIPDHRRVSGLSGNEIYCLHKLVMNSLNRMLQEALRYGGVGISGVTFYIVSHGGNLEFITVGSTVHSPEN